MVRIDKQYYVLVFLILIPQSLAPYSLVLFSPVYCEVILSLFNHNLQVVHNLVIFNLYFEFFILFIHVRVDHLKSKLQKFSILRILAFNNFPSENVCFFHKSIPKCFN